jgi:ketosteroid isomerase-like protein
MKTLLILSIFFASFSLSGSVSAQDAESAKSIERIVRDLDRREAEAVLKGDFATIERLWAPDLIINNPFNQVVEAKDGPIRTGALTYSSFVREAESIRVHGDVAIVMGREIVVPKDDSPDAGQTIHRRYTNIWLKRDGTWLLTGRHASVIGPSLTVQ